jgi:hypothetical protein
MSQHQFMVEELSKQCSTFSRQKCFFVGMQFFEGKIFLFFVSKKFSVGSSKSKSLSNFIIQMSFAYLCKAVRQRDLKSQWDRKEKLGSVLSE